MATRIGTIFAMLRQSWFSPSAPHNAPSSQQVVPSASSSLSSVQPRCDLPAASVFPTLPFTSRPADVFWEGDRTKGILDKELEAEQDPLEFTGRSVVAEFCEDPRMKRVYSISDSSLDIPCISRPTFDRQFIVEDYVAPALHRRSVLVPQEWSSPERICRSCGCNCTWRELQNSLWRPILMILSPVRFLAN